MNGTKRQRFRVLLVGDRRRAELVHSQLSGHYVANFVDVGSLTAAKSTDIGVVINCTVGVDLALLRAIRKAVPNARRIQLGGLDPITAVQAFNQELVHRVVVDSANCDELVQVVDKSLERFDLDQERAAFVDQNLRTFKAMVVDDRLRCLSAMASGISHHLRNALTVLTTYFSFMDDADGSDAFATLTPKRREVIEAANLAMKGNAEKATQRILRMVQGISATAVEPISQFDSEIECELLLRNAWERARREPSLSVTRVDGEEEPNSDVFKLTILHGANDSSRLKTIRCDEPKLERAFRILFRYLKQSAPKRRDAVGGIIEIEVSITPLSNCQECDGGPGLELSFLVDGAEWVNDTTTMLFTPFAVASNAPSELNVELLTAYFLVTNHRGSIEVQPGDIETNGDLKAPAIRLRLLENPELSKRPHVEDGLLERVLLHQHRWRCLQTGD